MEEKKIGSPPRPFRICTRTRTRTPLDRFSTYLAPDCLRPEILRQTLWLAPIVPTLPAHAACPLKVVGCRGNWLPDWPSLRLRFSTQTSELAHPMSLHTLALRDESILGRHMITWERPCRFDVRAVTQSPPIENSRIVSRLWDDVCLGMGKFALWRFDDTGSSGLHPTRSSKTSNFPAAHR